MVHLKRTRIKLSVVLLAYVLLGDSTYSQEGASVGGRITDAVTHEPVPSANVVLQGLSLGATTDLDGRFIVKGIPPGEYVVVASSVGYETRELRNVILREGEGLILEIGLTEKSVLMADVTVIGASLRSEKITDAPAAVSVVDHREIKLNSVSGQVPRLLETQPGVDIVQSGIHDYNVNTRGFNSSLNRRLLVLLDGRDLAIAFLGSQEWNGFSSPVEDFGKLELIRGPGSALYGANAFNGVINILTPPPRTITGGKLTLAGGELSSLRVDARYAGLAGKWSYKVNVGRSQSDTWDVSRLTFPFEYEGFDPLLHREVVGVDPSKTTSTYGSGRVDYELSQDKAATLEGGISQVENSVLVTGIGRIQVPKATKPWLRVNYSSRSWFVQAWGAGRNSVEPQISLSTGLPLKEESLIGQIDVQYRFSEMSNKLFVVLGAAHRSQFVGTEETLTLEDHHDNSSSVYAQLEFRFAEELKAVAASRWDRSTLHAGRISPKIALVLSPGNGHSFRATFNQAFQAPNYSELFLYVKHPIRNLAYIGNENLTVETITGYEIGYTGVFGEDLFVTFDAYFNQIGDFITDLAPAVNPDYPGQVVLPGDSILRTVWSYGNAGRVDETGFELAIKYQVWSSFSVEGNYAFFDFKVLEQGANDILLPNAPRDKFNIGLNYREGRLETGVSLKYVPSFDWAAGIYKGRILAYSLLNLNASYDVTDHFRVALNVTNLLDRVHYQIFGGSLLYRRAVISLTATF